MAAATERSIEKKQAILKAATDLFIERGYDGVSIDAIVREVGGSKSNIYNYFGGKEGLFCAIVEDLSLQILSPLQAAEIDNLPLREALTAIGKQVMSVVLSDRAIALLRIVISQNQQFPELGHLFFNTGPKPICDGLAQYIQTQQEKGLLKPCESQQATKEFVGMFLGMNQMQRLLGITEAPSQKEVASTIDNAVTVFLEGYGYD